MTTLDLQRLCNQAIEAARKAGAVIREYRNLEVKVDRKATGNSEASQVVTEVDRKAQDIIVETLAPTLAQYDLALLAEESADDGKRLEKSAFWAIDPMDGTLAFVRNVAGYSVSIALVSRAGEPLIGVVFDPINDELYHAIKGADAYRNGKVISPAPADPDAPLVLVADISFRDHPRLRDMRDGFNEIAATMGYPGARIEFRIGAVMNAITVLQNPNHCYVKLARPDNAGGSIWDYAATACLYREANAIACDVFGDPLELNRPTSTFMNHRGVIYATSPNVTAAIIKFNAALR